MGTVNYNFTYLEPDNQINLVGDTTTFLNQIDATIKSIDYKWLPASSYGVGSTPSATKIAEYVSYCLDNGFSPFFDQNLILAEDVTFGTSVKFRNIETSGSVRISVSGCAVYGDYVHSTGSHAVIVEHAANSTIDISRIKSENGAGVRITQPLDKVSWRNKFRFNVVEGTDYGILINPDTWGVLDSVIEASYVIGNKAIFVNPNAGTSERVCFCGNVVFNIAAVNGENGIYLLANHANSEISGLTFRDVSLESCTGTAIKMERTAGSMYGNKVFNSRIYEIAKIVETVSAPIIHTIGNVRNGEFTFQTPIPYTYILNQGTAHYADACRISSDIADGGGAVFAKGATLGQKIAWDYLERASQTLGDAYSFKVSGDPTKTGMDKYHKPFNEWLITGTWVDNYTVQLEETITPLYDCEVTIFKASTATVNGTFKYGENVLLNTAGHSGNVVATIKTAMRSGENYMDILTTVSDSSGTDTTRLSVAI